MYVQDLLLNGFGERIPNQVIFNFVKSVFLAFWVVVGGILVNTPVQFDIFYCCGGALCCLGWGIHYLNYKKPVPEREESDAEEVDPLS